VFLVSRDFQDRFAATITNNLSDEVYSSLPRLPKVLDFLDTSKENLNFTELLKECEELFKNMRITDSQNP